MTIFDYTFKYPTLDRYSDENGRKYILPDGSHVSSVTTILGATKSIESKEALDGWRKFKGDKEADRIRNEAAAVGHIIHTKLEQHLLGNELSWGSNLIQKVAKKMTETIIREALPRIEKIYGLESMLYIEGLYAGAADLVVQMDNEIIIGDFKNSLKIKDEKYLDDYFGQLCAYAIAHNHMFDTDIKSARIMMVARPDTLGNCAYKEFILEGEQFKKFSNLWLNRVDNYYKNFKK